MRTRHAPAQSTVGAILAGGRASRMGGAPKGLERVGDERIVDRALRALRSVTPEVVLVADPLASAGWLPGVRVVPDLLPAAGPAGGVHAALRHSAKGVLALAWDMPFVPVPLLGELMSLAADGGADAVVPEGEQGPEPLCAWYGPGCARPFEEGILGGERSLVRLLATVRVERLPRERVRRHGDPRVVFANVNDPADLARARALAEIARGAEVRG